MIYIDIKQLALNCCNNNNVKPVSTLKAEANMAALNHHNDKNKNKNKNNNKNNNKKNNKNNDKNFHITCQHIEDRGKHGHTAEERFHEDDQGTHCTGCPA